VERAQYDGLAEEYDAFLAGGAGYYDIAADVLRRFLGPGEDRCLDVGCGTGRFVGVAAELGWQPVGIDASGDQLRVARAHHPDAELVQADASAIPFPDRSFAAAYSTFTHTDFDDFAGALSEIRRVLTPGGRFVYVGNHPCFVGPTQEHLETGTPRLHAGYRRGGRWDATEAPGATPGGWRARLGSFVHLPLGDFLSCFAGFVLESVEEPEDGWDYPKTIALAFRKP
jgi:SAM-dependent methyltransferase